MPSRRPNQLRDVVAIVAYDNEGSVILEERVDVHDYYDEPHPVIDSDEFRRGRRVTRVKVSKYDASGILEETIELNYGPSGNALSRRVVPATDS